MPKITVDVPEELLARLDDLSTKAGQSREEMLHDAIELAVDHFGEMFGVIHDLRAKYPDLSEEEFEAKLLEHFEVDDEDEDDEEDDHKGCCAFRH